MKNSINSIITIAILGLAAGSVQAQGLISFANTSSTKISTNMTVSGPAMAPISAVNPQYHFALLYSSQATSVNGRTAAMAGGTNLAFVFTDTNWTLAAYGSNNSSGQFVSISPISGGATLVSNVLGGSSAQFVVLGWSVGVGADLAAVQSWFNGGNPAFRGWLGQSAVSGPITLGTSTAATLFGASAPLLQGFLLGEVAPAAPVAPVITSQPTNATVAQGATASFSVSAYGTPTPAYQWMFNGSNVIAGATQSTLTLNNLQPAAAGSYSVTITNSAGVTNSSAATLVVTAPTGSGYLVFANGGASVTKIYTNSAVGGAATGLTAAGSPLYCYALYASTNTAAVNGQTTPILGAASSNYAFNDPNWTLVALGTNSSRGVFASAAATAAGYTPVPQIPPDVAGQFVVLGWSADLGLSVDAVQTWFNGGNPASDGWIGQSAVSGPITLGSPGMIPVPPLFGTNAPQLQGFVLGLASPNPSTTYPVPSVPPALLRTSLGINAMQLSWLTAAGSFGVQSAPYPSGPWTDLTGLPVTYNGSYTVAVVTNTYPNKFFRLVTQ